MRNVALFGRRELEAHRRFVTGVTASKPAYVEVDSEGHKEFVVDVFVGPLLSIEDNIIRNVPIAPYAKQLIGDVRQPVTLERSKQGKYTVIARAKVLPAGAQMPDGSILEPSFHKIEYNLAELRLLHIADLDYTLEPWGEKPWGEEGKPWQLISATDAFGAQVMGEGVDEEDVPPALLARGTTVTTARHLVITGKTWGPSDSSDTLKWGADPWGAPLQKTVELVT